jgi:hypothetical protein
LPAAHAARAGVCRVLFYQKEISLAPALLLVGCLLLYLLLVAAALVEGLIRPLQTLSNVVSSLREGDYSFARAEPARRTHSANWPRGQRAGRPAAEAARALA